MKISLEEKLIQTIRSDKYSARKVISAAADMIAFGDIDEYPMLFDSGVITDEEQRVRAQAYSALIAILQKGLNHD